ncbi:MAG: hypothetical protein HOP30_21850 [Cyclobacteriaceae bacterium]|nr:hypothetical protein [Cyclobacteriaceae bacterium]
MIQSSGLTIDKFYIPPFTVDAGDIVVIELPDGQYFSEVLLKLVDILTSKNTHPSITVKTEFTFVKHIVETGWARFFRPMTVGRYIKIQGNPADGALNNIYEICDFKSTMPLNRIPRNQKMMLSMLTTLSWTKNIIFDFRGVDPVGAQTIYSLVKEKIHNGGTAILLDNYDDFKNDCTKFIKYEMVGD